jgi:hypothetical protein
MTPPSAVYGRAQCITTTRFDGHHPTDKTQRTSGPPSGPPEICMGHRRRSQRRIWGQELAPSRPQPPTGGRGHGRNTTGGWLADDPRGAYRLDHARGWWCGVWCTDRSPVLFFPAAPGHVNNRKISPIHQTTCPMPPIAPRRRPFRPHFMHLFRLVLMRSRWPSWPKRTVFGPFDPLGKLRAPLPPSNCTPPLGCTMQQQKVLTGAQGPPSSRSESIRSSPGEHTKF